MIVIHPPMKCQNGHDNVLITEFRGGNIISQHFLRPLCGCPKGEMGEGYAPSERDWVEAQISSFFP